MDPFYWSFILLGLGLLVVVVELFIPSAGVLGVIAAVMLISSIVVGFVDSVQTGLIVMLATCMALPLMFVLLVKVWPSTPIGRRMITRPMSQDEVMPIDDYVIEIKQLVDKVGRAKTKMLPSGIIIIDHKQYDAISDGFAIEPGDPVKVVAIRFNRIYVQPYNPEDDMATHFDNENLLERKLEDLGLADLDESQ